MAARIGWRCLSLEKDVMGTGISHLEGIDSRSNTVEDGSCNGDPCTLDAVVSAVLVVAGESD